MKFLILLILACSFFESDVLSEWDKFEKEVRDQKLKKSDAVTKFPAIFTKLKNEASIFAMSYDEKWIMPVSGATSKDYSKDSYRPNGYNFFDGNSHGGHAAYDIFVLDRNYDSRHDKTGKPFSVVAPADLLVISVNTGWSSSSVLRGGNYIWAFNSKSDLFFYFAHLDTIKVSRGDFVKRGSLIATLGRTGKNAFPKRSPTHLHLTVLKSDGIILEPYDFYFNLK